MRNEGKAKMKLHSYSEIKDFRLEGLALAARNNECLNEFHDLIFEQVITVSLNKMKRSHGTPPSPFTFFVLGSAGRMEQSIWSDQDHGMIFEHDNMASTQYFLKLGAEISTGLELVGYLPCSGRVMSSNPMWCKSESEWKQQVAFWADDSSWESIRYLLILADSRPLYGEASLLSDLKKSFLAAIEEEYILFRMLQNTMHVKKGVGVLGQLLVETHGAFSGSINLKDTAFFPFVNAVRLLALKEGISETSTLSRIKLISEHILSVNEKRFFSGKFSKLLEYRLLHSNHSSYETGHYVNGERLTKADKKELKEILKAGEQFYVKVRKYFEKDLNYGHE
jgi:CBS domain-containing protein